VSLMILGASTGSEDRTMQTRACHLHRACALHYAIIARKRRQSTIISTPDAVAQPRVTVPTYQGEKASIRFSELIQANNHAPRSYASPENLPTSNALASYWGL
jgi:hypothetical protein